MIRGFKVYIGLVSSVVFSFSWRVVKQDLNCTESPCLRSPFRIINLSDRMLLISHPSRSNQTSDVDTVVEKISFRKNHHSNVAFFSSADKT